MKLMRIGSVGIMAIVLYGLAGCANPDAVKRAMASRPLEPPNVEKKQPIASFDRKWLIGRWETNYGHIGREFKESNLAGIDWTPSSYFCEYEFKEDGSYKMRQVINGEESSANGVWNYKDGFLTMGIRTNGIIPVNREYKVVPYSRNEFDKQWASNRHAFEYWDSFYRRHKNPAQLDLQVTYTENGCFYQNVVQYYPSYTLAWESYNFPERYHRIGDVSAMPMDKGQAAYTILSCTRENGDGFSYQFELKLEKDKSLRAFRNIQQEFRSVLREDYVESTPGMDDQKLYVDFPEYRFENGKIIGRATILSITPVQMKYDSNTRTGRLAVKVKANQYEEARKWIRKNIETLARDKNIALTTGEIPPAAKFYLGREELKDGNVLEIEFRTE